MAEDLKVSVGADVDGLKSGLRRGVSEVEKATADMRGVIGKTTAEVVGKFKNLRDEFAKGLTIKVGLASDVQAKIASVNDQFQKGAISAKAHAAEVERLNAELKQIEAAGTGVRALGGSFRTLNSSVSGVVSTLARLPVIVGTVVGALAGGVFATSVRDTRKFADEATYLARAFGITATEASALNVAIGDVYSDAETLIGAASVLGRQLRQNEDDLKALGLATRDASGNLRSQKDLMLESIGIVNSYKEGTDKNLAATVFFGRGASDLTDLLKLNNDVLDAAKQKQADLALTITEEGVQANKDYKAALNDAGDVMLAVKKAIADAVMPALTMLANWFASFGPDAVMVTKVAINSLMTAFYALKTAVVAVAAVLNALVGTFAEPLMSLGQALLRLARGDISGATSIMMGLGDRVAARWKLAMKDVQESAQNSAKAVANVWSAGTPVAEPKNAPTETFVDPKSKKDKAKEESLVPKFEAELSELKAAHTKKNAAEGTFIEFGLERERQFWASKLGVLKAGTKDYQSVDKKVNDLIVQQGEQAFQERMATLDREIAEIDNNAKAKLAIVDQEVALVLRAYGDQSKQYQDILRKRAAAEKAVRAEAFGDTIAALRKEELAAENNAAKKVDIVAREVDATIAQYGKESKQYEEVLGRQLQALKAAREQRLQLKKIEADQALAVATAAIDAEQALAEQEYANKRLTIEQLLQLEVEFQNRRRALRLDELNRTLAATDPELDPVKYAEIKTQIEALELQHQAKMREIRGKLDAAAKAPELAVFDTLESQFATAAQGILLQTQTLGQGMKSVFSAVSASFVSELITKPLAQMAARVVRESALYRAMFGAQISGQASASSAVAGIKASETAGVVGLNASQAASGAAASQAAIPIAGPALAIAAALSMLAFVKGIGGGGGGGGSTGNGQGVVTRIVPSVPSAAGGFDIPGGMNPLTQLHEREMVLPQYIADPLRDSLAGGGGLASGANITINAADPRGMERWLRNGGAQMIAEAMRGRARNFAG